MESFGLFPTEYSAIARSLIEFEILDEIFKYSTSGLPINQLYYYLASTVHACMHCVVKTGKANRELDLMTINDDQSFGNADWNILHDSTKIGPE